MEEPVHMAVTRRVRPEYAREFEQRLAEFASQTLTIPGARGIHMLHPAPGAKVLEYGILRSFASAAASDAFYRSALYQEWSASIQHMVEGAPERRELTGLEAWFRTSHSSLPPRWKMAILTWLAVWPVSMLVPMALAPIYPAGFPVVLRAGIGAAGIVLVLTWAAMPLLVKLAKPWLHRVRPTRTTHSIPL